MIDDERIEAIALMQYVGDNGAVLEFLEKSPQVLSVYHTIGEWCYVLRTSFEDKPQLEAWLKEVKCITASDDSLFPTVSAIQTLKIIDEYKEDTTLEQYRNSDCQHHAFMKIGFIGDDSLFVKDFQEHPAVRRILHVQGDTSFVMEILTDKVDTIRKIISLVKCHKGVVKVVTQEVISVVKHS